MKDMAIICCGCGKLIGCKSSQHDFLRTECWECIRLPSRDECLSKLGDKHVQETSGICVNCEISMMEEFHESQMGSKEIHPKSEV